LLLTSSLSKAQDAAPQRPQITGVSHVGYFVSNLPNTIAFWHDLLGFDEYTTLNKPGTDQIRIAFIKISDQQHIELFTDAPASPPNMMSHYCFTCDNVDEMRAYLRSKGFDVKPGNGGKTRTGDYAFEIKDPDGTLVEFVQSLPTGIEMQAAGKFMPPTRIADAIYHVGFLVGTSGQVAGVLRRRILGFTETWRGSSNRQRVLSWVNLRVPDGKDYIELMLYEQDTVGLRDEEPCVAGGCRMCRRRSRRSESRPGYKDYQTHAEAAREMQVGEERQAPGESLRSGRNARGIDGSANRRWKTGATLHRAAAGPGARVARPEGLNS
jgi:catechol 2,3-dioxygenase-like lactoylglutathione lyase family enzyme